VNTKRISSGDDLSAALDDFEAGETVKLTLWKDGETRTVNVTLNAP